MQDYHYIKSFKNGHLNIVPKLGRKYNDQFDIDEHVSHVIDDYGWTDCYLS